MEVRAVVFGDVGRAHAREDGYLGDDVVHLIFGIFNVYDLDGNQLARLPINAAEGQFVFVLYADSRNLPFVHLAEAASACALSAYRPVAPACAVPMHCCFVYSVVGSTDPLKPSPSAMAVPFSQLSLSR